jgi:hypothetical protein
MLQAEGKGCMGVAWSTAKHDSVAVRALMENLAKSGSFEYSLIDRSEKEKGIRQTQQQRQKPSNKSAT